MNQKRLPCAEHALDLQLATHRRDQMMADGQAQPGAAGGGARLGLRERLEDLRQRFGLDADAGVADLEAADVRRRPGAIDQPHLARRR